MRDPNSSGSAPAAPVQAEMMAEGPQELPVIPELDDYELIRELGRGGTAVVYLARERELGRLVAIKLMHPSYVQDEEAMQRLVRTGGGRSHRQGTMREPEPYRFQHITPAFGHDILPDNPSIRRAILDIDRHIAAFDQQQP